SMRAAAAPTTTSDATTSSGSPHGHRAFSVVYHKYQATEGTVTFDVDVPWISGDDLAVVDRFNNSVLSSLHDQQVALGNDGSTSGYWTVSSQDAQAVIGTDVITGLLITSVNHHDPMSAHPTPHIATFVINKATAQPVMLTDLFTDQHEALQRLSNEARQQIIAKIGSVDESGIAPTAKNFANWIPTSYGIEIHFDDYQVGPHAAGLQVVTMPWSVFAGVLAQKLY
ncbi:RsiV family protein, partial [Smaragdicoccus niigatensis]|uniref:RsiV family protein n=1 Tax=Smaragdicoccus niigatensis TaxID=359359 RepID=UPI0039EFC48D